MNKYIDFRSDTVTKPTPAMRKAMAEVEIGGDICKENSTVINLQKRMASILGKEASLFFPTGTMANLISVMGHCWERDSEVLLGDMSHIHLYEQGGVSQLSNIKVTTLKTKSDGTFDFEEILDKINSSNCSKNVLLCLENTHNRCGGAVLSLQYMEKIASLANCYKMKIHMDGARIFNASIKLGIPVSTLLKNCDSVSTCLSKGLGAPAGSVVAGNLDFIRRLEKLRKIIGGEIIKSSILAAAGLVAIETMVERLKIDHEHAFKIGKAIYDMKSKAVTVNLCSIETNMILIDINQSYLTADKFSMDLSKPIEDMPTVKMGVISPTRLRCVLHADISSDDVDKAITKIQKVIKEVMNMYKSMADEKVFNLETDEFSKPTLLMKTAISEAEVGDDVYREDPTVLKLEETISKLLGKEAALFFPTDIMANLAAIMGHCWERGSEILIGETSSIFRSNQNGIAHLAGVYIRTLTTKSDGTFDTEEIINKIRSSNIHEPKTTLLCLENTYEMGGGRILTPDYMNKIANLSKNFKFAIHLDGTRIMNAAVKLGMPVATLVESCDSVTICLSKGLCAPVGSVVAGNTCFIDRLLRCRKVLGGGMRQVGVLAAAGLIAINTMVERLKDDHDNAFKIGKGINDMRSKIFYVDLDSIQTNIVHICINPNYSVAEKFVFELSKPMENLPAVRIGIISSKILCCMLYADIDSNDVKIIITKIQKVIEKIESSYTYM